MHISRNLPFKIVPERPGYKSDLQLLKNDHWLLDTEVHCMIRNLKSKWLLTIIFVDINDPLRVVCREIDHFTTFEKAEKYAKIFQKGIRKESRGALQIRNSAFNLCNN